MNANFNYEVLNYGRFGAIAIECLDGAKSVTNDIENVVSTIETKHKIDAKNFYVVYRDTRGNWDGWDAEKQDFIILNESGRDLAVKKLHELKHPR